MNQITTTLLTFLILLFTISAHAQHKVSLIGPKTVYEGMKYEVKIPVSNYGANATLEVKGAKVLENIKLDYYLISANTFPKVYFNIKTENAIVYKDSILVMRQPELAVHMKQGDSPFYNALSNSTISNKDDIQFRVGVEDEYFANTFPQENRYSFKSMSIRVVKGRRMHTDKTIQGTKLTAEWLQEHLEEGDSLFVTIKDTQKVSYRNSSFTPTIRTYLIPLTVQ